MRKPRRSPVTREIQAIRRSLSSIVRALDRLRPVLVGIAASDRGDPPRRRRKLTLSAARRAAPKAAGPVHGPLANPQAKAEGASQGAEGDEGSSSGDRRREETRKEVGTDPHGSSALAHERVRGSEQLRRNLWIIELP